MTLCLHSGAELVPYDQLRDVPVPEGTDTHVPVPHHDIVELMRYTLGFYGHDIVDEHHAITEDGSRYFGLLSLKSTYGEYEDTIGLRNSHDKSFPIGIAFGSRVFVCDNTAFIADHVIRRKHTVKAKRELPGLLAELVEPLREQREQQQITFDRYRATALSDELADHAILDLYRQNVINVQRIPVLMQEWAEPSFEGFEERNAWRLFNAATYALSGKVAEKPAVTSELHNVIDGVCERIH